VPTRAGLVFGLTLLLLLVASINFQLNLGYALTFLLAGSAIVSMHMTHATLRGLALHLGPLSPVFAGQPVSLEVRMDNPGRTRHGLALAVQEDEGEPQPVWFDAGAQAQTSVTLHWMAPGRGHWPAPLLRIETRFPFGLFRAWGLWRPDAQAWVYPAPEHPAPPCPRPSRPARPARRPWARPTSMTASAPGAGATRSTAWSGRRSRARANWSAARPRERPAPAALAGLAAGRPGRCGTAPVPPVRLGAGRAGAPAAPWPAPARPGMALERLAHPPGHPAAGAGAMVMLPASGRPSCRATPGTPSSCWA
jgi:hypothetical protein